MRRRVASKEHRVQGPELLETRALLTVVAGWVHDDGVAEPDVTVNAIETLTGLSHATTTAGNGTYSLDLPAGNYTLTANGQALENPVVAKRVAVAQTSLTLNFDASLSLDDGDDILGRVAEELWVGESGGTVLATNYYGSWPNASIWEDVATADVNGDGLDDVVGRADGTWWVALSTGDSSFVTRSWGNWSSTTTWSGVNVGDYNGDGLDDIAGRAGDGTFWVALSTGNAFVTEYWGAWSNTTNWEHIQAGDFNGDGRTDLAGRAQVDGTWWVATSMGDRFTNGYYGVWSSSVGWHDVSTGDFNGDGLTDIVGRTDSGHWWMNRTTAQSYFHIEFWGTSYVGTTWSDVSILDVDGDGDDDIAQRADSDGTWWIARSTGASFQNQYWGAWSTSVPWSDVRVADNNGDGKGDILGRTGDGQWWALRSTGSQFSSLYVGAWSNNVPWQDVLVGSFNLPSGASVEPPADFEVSTSTELSDALAQVQDGQTILLTDGSFGTLDITGRNNTLGITLAAKVGHTPTFTQVAIQASSGWTVRGIHVLPRYVSGADGRNAVTLSGSHLTIENSTINYASDVTNWTAADWLARTGNGIAHGGTNIVIRNNDISHIDHGISGSAQNLLLSRNRIVNFRGDGIRSLGDDAVIEYNTIKNSYDVDGNHDDGIQSWSTGPSGVGSGVVRNVTIRGNTIINYEDPNQPLRGTMQGIGLFDGFFENWVVENNLVAVDHWHGISFYGARNSRIVNNTVIDLNASTPGPPWIMVNAHKNGAPSEAVVVRNNLTTRLVLNSGVTVNENNIIVTNLSDHFVDPSVGDYHLLASSSAIDTGSATEAPAIDLEGTERPQGAGIDVGAFEFTGT